MGDSYGQAKLDRIQFGVMARPSSPAGSARRSRRATTDEIVRRVTAAITEHRLPPGTKLGEESLGDAFGVSRTKAREALFQLAKLKLVTLLPARGAFVAQPTVREAREVFGARRIVERAVVDQFARAATATQLAAIRAHVAAERDAVAANDVWARSRLLGEFPVLIAEMAGNSVVADLLRELVSRTSLITLLYQTASASVCSADEHLELVKRFERRDAKGAVALMLEHLDHVEQGLSLREDAGAAVDLRSALAAVRV
jgi:DNA-binding GntR family transcriptional regulator